MQEEQAAHQGCRVKHGRQRRTAERRSHRWGQQERGGGDGEGYGWGSTGSFTAPETEEENERKREAMEEKRSSCLNENWEEGGGIDRVTSFTSPCSCPFFKIHLVSHEPHYKHCLPGEAPSPFTMRLCWFHVTICHESLILYYPLDTEHVECSSCCSIGTLET